MDKEDNTQQEIIVVCTIVGLVAGPIIGYLYGKFMSLML